MTYQITAVEIEFLSSELVVKQNNNDNELSILLSFTKEPEGKIYNIILDHKNIKDLIKGVFKAYSSVGCSTSEAILQFLDGDHNIE